MTLKLLSHSLSIHTRSVIIPAQRRYLSDLQYLKRVYDQMDMEQRNDPPSNNNSRPRPRRGKGRAQKSQADSTANPVDAASTIEPRNSAGNARRRPAAPKPPRSATVDTTNVLAQTPTVTTSTTANVVAAAAAPQVTAGGAQGASPGPSATTAPTGAGARTEGAPTPRAKRPRRPRADKLRSQEAHLQVVLDAARTTIQILQPHGLTCAVFGSLASKLYGCSRMPKDVDMIVRQTSPPLSHRRSNSPPQQPIPPQPTAHEIKELLVRMSPRNFYLRMPRDPTAPYRILWYRRYFRGPECKVDILIPGEMHLPALRSSGRTSATVTWKDNIPLVPFPVLLYHKLQGWSDHVNAEEEHKRRKQAQDAADVRRLLSLVHEMAKLRKMPLGGLQDDLLFSEEFRKLTLDRVRAYCLAFGDRSGMWQSLGFEVPEQPEQIVAGNYGAADSEVEEMTGLAEVQEDEDDGVVLNYNVHPVTVDLMGLSIVDHSPVPDRLHGPADSEFEEMTGLAEVQEDEDLDVVLNYNVHPVTVGSMGMTIVGH